MPSRDAAGPAPRPQPRPARLLFAGTTFAVGGAERIFAHLVRGLAGRFDVEVLALREPGPIGEELRRSGLPVTSGLTGAARFDPLLLPRIRAFLRRRDITAIYFLDHAHAVFHGTLASLGTGVRVRLMPVHTTGQWNGTPSLKRPIRLVRSRLDRIIAIAEAQRDYLVREEGVPPGQLVVIPNGVPLSGPGPEERARRRLAARAALGLPDDALVAGITAVLRPEKNHELLLRAFARVRAAVPAARLLVAGDGPRRAALEAEARRLGLMRGGSAAGRTTDRGTPAAGDPVAFLGHRPDVRALMPAFDVAMLTSHPRVETLPLSLIEAMDEALPVIATRVGALHEMVEEGASGLLVPSGDEDALAAALQRLLESPAERRIFGERGQRIAAERFSVERMVDATGRLLQDLLG